MNVKLKNDNGITIVALIITLIVLIILAAVTIMAVSDSDFVNISQASTQNYAQSQIDELKSVESTSTFLEQTISNLISNQVEFEKNYK